MSKTDRSPLFYMANLGAEVARLIIARKQSIIEAQASLARCLSILDSYQKVEASRKREPEISMLRNVLIDFINDQRKYRVDSRQLESYFRPFALRFLQQ